jgi:hypothetical protein
VRSLSVIRFNVILSVVIVAVGLLIAGAVSGSLVLVDSAIGVAALALVLLVAIVVMWRQEIFGDTVAGVAATGTTGAAAGEAAPDNMAPAPEHELPVGFSADGQLASTPAGRGVQISQSARAAQSTRSAHSAEVGQSAAEQSVGLSQGERDADVLGLAGRAGRGSAQKADPPIGTGGDFRRREGAPAGRERPVGDSAAARSGVEEVEEPASVDERRASRGSTVAEPVPAEGSPAAGPPAAPPASAPSGSAGSAPAPSGSARSAPASPAPAPSVPVPSGPVPSAPVPGAAAKAAKAAKVPADVSPDAGSTAALAGAGNTAETTAANVRDKADSPSVTSASQPAAAASTDTQVTVVPGIARYHVPGCILIRFLGAEDLQEMTREAAESSGCVPCKACRPDSVDK